MPIGTLPKPLVIRLRKAFKRGERIEELPNRTSNEFLMGRMKNADHRAELVKGMHMPTYFFGGRVRELDVRRNYPTVGSVIIKRMHGITAPRLVRLLRNTVDMHNKRFPSKLYTLRKPVAYSLNEEYVAMKKVPFPSVAEIVGTAIWDAPTGKIERIQSNFVTPRGIEYFSKLQRAHPECTPQALEKAVDELEQHTDGVYHQIHSTNVLLAGFEKGKFIFVPLVDLK